MNLAEDLRASLQDILVPGAVEIRENGSRVTSATPLSWEVRGNSEKPLLHLWSENCNVTRRVVAITDNSQDRLALAVERFGRVKPERMEIVRLEYAPAPKRNSSSTALLPPSRHSSLSAPSPFAPTPLRTPRKLSYGSAAWPSPAGTNTKFSSAAIPPGRNCATRTNPR